MMGKLNLQELLDMCKRQHERLIKADDRIKKLEAATPKAYIAAIQKQAALEKELSDLKEKIVEFIGMNYDAIYENKINCEGFKEYSNACFSDVIEEVTKLWEEKR